MDDRPFFSAFNDKEHGQFGRHSSDATTRQRKFSHHTAQCADKPNPFSLPTLTGSPGETRKNKRKSKMKLRLSIWTMLIAGSLLSAPTLRA
jgi:hypothetical protein